MNLINPQDTKWSEIKDAILEGEGSYRIGAPLDINLILDKVYKGEYAYLRNSDINVIGYTYLNERREKVFFIYYAWGKNLKDNIENFRRTFSRNYGCDRIEYRSTTRSHDRLYRLLMKREDIREYLTISVKL